MYEDYLKAKTVGQILDETTAKWPDQESLIYPDENLRYTWRELKAEVDRLARGLMALGVKRGEKVAIWATNVSQWLTFFYATAKIGVILVTVNTHYKRAELEYLLSQSESEYLALMGSFRGHDYVQTIKEIVPELETKPRGRELESPVLPCLKKVFFLGEEEHRGLYKYSELLAEAGNTPPADYEARQALNRPSDVVNMQYTSGTTGFPKGVMLTHTNIVTNGYWIGYFQGLSQRDRICLPVPLFHCFGLVLGNMAAVNHGSCMVVLNIYSPYDILTSIAKERCTAIYGVPTMFITLLEHKSFDNFDLSTLRTGIMAGSPCPVKTMVEVIEKMHAREITICYGLTETSPVLSQTRADDDLTKKTETVGQIMPGVSVRIVNPDTNEPLSNGQMGEVVAKGYGLMAGYYNNPEATAEIIDEDGWLHSGDLGFMDEDGYLVITGRWKDMIIRGGENIYPQEIEEYLRRMPGISDVQVVGVPSKLHGEEIGAFIVKSDPDLVITATEVKAYLRPLISGYKIPRFVADVKQFPLTASGKVQKYKLREMALSLWPKTD